MSIFEAEQSIEGVNGTSSLVSILKKEKTGGNGSDAASPSTNSRAATAYSRSRVVTGVPLCLSDVAVVLATSSLVAYCVVAPLWGVHLATSSLLLVGLSVACPLVFYTYNLYPGVGLNAAHELRQLSKASTMLAMVYIAATTVQDFSPGTNTIVVAVSWPCWLVGLPLARRFVRRQLACYSWWGLRTIVIGSSPEAEAVNNILRQEPALGLRPAGVVDDLHSLSSVGKIAEEENAQHAAVVVSHIGLQDVLRLLANGDHGFLQLTVIPSVDEPFDLGLCTIDVGNHTLGLVGQQRLLLPLNRFLKRFFDLTIVIVGSIMALPCLLGIMLLIKMSSRGPIFYKALRVGRHGRRFYAWKFRTMVPNADQLLKDYLAGNPERRREWERNAKIKNDPRITKVGNILRRTSLDELPQLWNVLRGDMSLVGPRPILVGEPAKYADVFSLYSRVLPGITGLWQVSGRNNTSYQDRLTYVASYVRNWSIWLDLCILAKTVVVVLRRDGAY